MTYEEKRRIIEGLLDHWQDYFAKAESGGGGNEDPNKPMSADWTILSSMSRHPAVIELNRCLEMLAEKMPQHFKQLRGFYSAEWRTVDKLAKKRDAHGRMVPETVRSRERVVPSWVRWRTVDSSLDVVVALWRVPRKDCAACQEPMEEFVDRDGSVKLRPKEFRECGYHVAMRLPAALNLRLREFTDQDGTHLTEAA